MADWYDADILPALCILCNYNPLAYTFCIHFLPASCSFSGTCTLEVSPAQQLFTHASKLLAASEALVMLSQELCIHCTNGATVSGDACRLPDEHCTTAMYAAPSINSISDGRHTFLLTLLLNLLTSTDLLPMDCNTTALQQAAKTDLRHVSNDYQLAMLLKVACGRQIPAGTSSCT